MMKNKLSYMVGVGIVALALGAGQAYGWGFDPKLSPAKGRAPITTVPPTLEEKMYLAELEEEILSEEKTEQSIETLAKEVADWVLEYGENGEKTIPLNPNNRIYAKVNVSEDDLSISVAKFKEGHESWGKIYNADAFVYISDENIDGSVDNAHYYWHGPNFDKLSKEQKAEINKIYKTALLDCREYLDSQEAKEIEARKKNLEEKRFNEFIDNAKELGL